MGTEQGLLDRVFDQRPREDLRASANQLRPVAADQELEGGVNAVRDEVGKSIVRLEPKKRCAQASG